MFNLPSGLDETSQLVFEVRLTDDTLRLFDCAVNGQGLPLESASAESPHHYRFDCPQSCLTSRNEVRLRVGSASPKAKPAVALHPQSISELIQVALVITER